MSITTLIIGLGFAGWFGWMFISHRRTAGQEMGRFKREQTGIFAEATEQLNTLATNVAAKKQKQTLRYHAAKSDKEMAKKLLDAGLESAAEQGKFLLFRAGCMIVFPLLGASTYLVFIPYYATITTLFCSGIGIVTPIMWLKARTVHRLEEIQRELPFVLDLTNLGTSAGWDVAASLERVVDTLYLEFPEHPLIKEFKRARWLTASGYTWNEALKRISAKLPDDTVRRTTLAIGQAIRQGGDRTKQLENIAHDAQRAYYTQLDKRLAALPVKALLATMILLVAYFIILLAPAAVQVKNIMMK